MRNTALFVICLLNLILTGCSHFRNASKEIKPLLIASEEAPLDMRDEANFIVR